MDTLKRTHDILYIKADPNLIYQLASEVENWPQILPHYRWVTVIKEVADGRIIDMAARRGSIPVRWQAIQRFRPSTRRILYYHTAGLTRGMEVEWVIEPETEGIVRVEIIHDLKLQTPLVNTSLGKYIVARMFIRHIAGQTLHHIKMAAERGYTL